MARTNKWNQRDTQRRISKHSETHQRNKTAISQHQIGNQSTNQLTLAQRKTRTKKAPINEQYEKPNNVNKKQKHDSNNTANNQK